VIEVVQTNGAIADMRDLLHKYVRLMPGVSKLDRVRMLIIYVFYNTLVAPSGKMPNWHVVFKKYEQDVKTTLCVENLLAELLMFDTISEKYEDCRQAYKQFCEGRFLKSTVEVPPLLEVKFQAELANMALREGIKSDFDLYLDMAIGDSASFPGVQDLLLNCRNSATPVEHKKVFSLLSPKGQEPVAAPAPAQFDPAAEVEPTAQVEPALEVEPGGQPAAQVAPAAQVEGAPAAQLDPAAQPAAKVEPAPQLEPVTEPKAER
jgi:hypothetical protein